MENSLKSEGAPEGCEGGGGFGERGDCGLEGGFQGFVETGDHPDLEVGVGELGGGVCEDVLGVGWVVAESDDGC